MSRIFFTSDLHVGHVNMLRYEPARIRKGMQLLGAEAVSPELIAHKGKAALSEESWRKASYRLDGYMLDQWNRVVGPEDVVYVLGDLAWTPERAEFFLENANGRIALVLGNHDLMNGRVSLAWWEERLYKVRPFSQRKTGEGDLCLSHIPIMTESIRPRWYAQLHGHIHGLPDPSPLHLNVSVERWRFRPVSMEVVMQTLATKLRGYLGRAAHKRVPRSRRVQREARG